MALQITITSLENGQEIHLPFEISGKVAPPNVSLVAWQVDDHEIHEIPTLPPTVDSVPFEFNIGIAECPVANAWYLLTVYAWETGGAVSTESRTFKRVEGTIIPDTGGPPPPGGMPPPLPPPGGGPP